MGNFCYFLLHCIYLKGKVRLYLAVKKNYLLFLLVVYKVLCIIDYTTTQSV